ncbi:HAD family hydrolase [Oxyplasma meridianum]|uniref:D,D-heptose 1,7-bisphosphate phosphatase n=1 Tax=Oxyplasma meridianum TaxID=3073602 RepID=A0AAX4NFW8_9ARCH
MEGIQKQRGKIINKKDQLMGTLRKALFIDRDGTIIEDVPYSADPSKIVIYQDAVELMKEYAGMGYLIVIVTNQSGINRGYFTRKDLEKFNNVLTSKLKSKGVNVHAIYFCPHKPDENCQCRKPKTGMVMDAAKDLGIDLKNSVMAGDREDMDGELARRTGMKFILMKK